MPWVEVFAVFVVSHLAGDFLLQTEWQATNKTGGLGHERVARRALLSHVTIYTVALVPALIWPAGSLSGAAVAGVALAVSVLHVIQDDGRPLAASSRTVKRIEWPGRWPWRSIRVSTC